jgi:hypothetical protein
LSANVIGHARRLALRDAAGSSSPDLPQGFTSSADRFRAESLSQADAASRENPGEKTDRYRRLKHSAPPTRPLTRECDAQSQRCVEPKHGRCHIGRFVATGAVEHRRVPEER